MPMPPFKVKRHGWGKRQKPEPTPWGFFIALALVVLIIALVRR